MQGYLKSKLPDGDAKLPNRTQSGRVNRVHRIRSGIQVLMQCGWVQSGTWISIARQKPSGERIEISRPQIAESKICVVLLPLVKIQIWCRTGDIDRATPGIVVVGVGNRARRVCQQAYTAHAIVTVKAGRPRAVDQLVLVDSAGPIGVRPPDRAIDYF